MNNKKLAIISIVLAAIFVGGTGAFSKLGLRTIPPITFTFLRFFVGSLFITPFLIKEKNRAKLSRSVLFLSIIQVVNVIVYAFGVRLTTATISQTLFSTVAILSAVFSYLLLKERFTTQKILGIIIGFIGALVIIVLPVISKSSAFNGNIIGNLFLCVSVVCLALYSTISKKFHKTYSPLFLTALFIYLTTLVSGVLAVPEVIAHPFFWKATSILGWVGVLYVGTFGIAFFLLYQYAVKHGSSTIASLSLYLAPVVAFIYASILLGERLTIGFIIGTIIALIGVFLVTNPLYFYRRKN